MLLKHVRQAHCADLEARIHQPCVAGQREHMCAQSADRGLFDGQDHFMCSNQVADHFFIKRLGKAQVGDSGAEALGIQRIGCLHRFG